MICESSKSTSKTIAKGAEQQRRRELENGFHDLKELRQQRVRWYSVHPECLQPGLTMQALAARTADYLVTQSDRVFTSEHRDTTSIL
ncbi:MAG: hypothetical protein M3Y50_15150 [Acidobacteriota bacterium]|nr:hypothetical protein [Acidobacteriota bacterium]